MEQTGVVHEKKSVTGFLWLLAVLYFFVVVGNSFAPQIITRDMFNFGSILLPFIFAIVHGKMRYGLKNMAVFAVISLIVGNFYENLSVETTFPFGNYYYSDNLGPKIWNVPIIIGFAYFSIGYLAWIMAQSLIGALAPVLKKTNIFFVPVVAAFLVASWDFSFDPDSSTINGDWVWREGGGYFGVPFSNFTGWYLCVYTFFQIFAWYISRQPESDFKNMPAANKTYWYQAAIFYAIYAIDFILGKYTAPIYNVTDPAGKTWSTGDIHDTMAIISIFTMIFFSILSLIIVKNNEKIPEG
ncbi:MAG TPA: carotenoid biosynthesis protein [Ignavibacteria bacterium]|nr:carotenoid biosynthesis protein [Ignavibacteria bacterium]